MLGENIDMLGQANLRGRVGEPSEVADVVLFLIGDESSYINGTVTVAGGGELSSMPS